MAFREGADHVDGFLELVEGKDFGFLRFDNFSSSEEDAPCLSQLHPAFQSSNRRQNPGRRQEKSRYRSLPCAYLHKRSQQ